MKTDPSMQAGRAVGLAWNPEEYQLLREAWRENPQRRQGKNTQRNTQRIWEELGRENQWTVSVREKSMVKNTVDSPIKIKAENCPLGWLAMIKYLYSEYVQAGD